MSAIARNQVFSAVHTIGGLIPADMLVRISEGRDVSGSTPADYRVFGSRSVRDEAERHWDYLRSVWAELRGRLPVAPEAETPADPTGLAVRQWLEPLFAELGFGRLTPVGAPGLAAEEGGKTFPISHRWQHVPIHLIPWNASLDRRPGGTAGTVPPQSMVQEFLNRSEAHLWGVLSNGRQLRLLRDSSALATAAYVEFDLEAIFDGELFSEFVLLYRLLHVSRFEVAPDAPVSTCWLERWRTEAIESGVRALAHLREAVREAVKALGTGFLRHPANAELRRNLDVNAYHAALLRLVYRLIFLFVAEDRGVLHHPDADEQARERYATYFSTARLRRQANRHRGTVHGDLYQALRLVLDGLGDENGRPELGLPGLGGLFDHTDADTPLDRLSLANRDLLGAIRHLSRVRDPISGRWRQIDYRNIGSEELGAVYEWLLESVPKHNATDGTFELVDRAGNNRKKTGSYYTPASLIETLLDSTLDPVIDDAQKRGELRASEAGDPDPTEHIVDELLKLTVCDPACGSGHFLVAAARRIAKRVASVREKNPEPTVPAVRHALHEVIARCVYGVDLNPMAVELAKVSLWMEALEPGKPLSFLDAHIKHGDGLIGATPALINDGIPTKAFKSIEGDDPSYARALARRNDQERQEHQPDLVELYAGRKMSNVAFAASLRRIAEAPANSLRDVRRQAAAYREWEKSSEYVHAKHVADAWCAAFMWHKAKEAPPAVTHTIFRDIRDPGRGGALPETQQEIVRLREQFKFFHWHLEFPDIFTVSEGESSDADPVTGWSGGFSCVVGNPPWDKVEFEDVKYFSVVDPSIAELSGAKRRSEIQKWIERYPEAGARYRTDRRRVKATFHFAASSGVYPLCAKGLTVKGVNSLQTDQLFAERFSQIVAPDGRLGCIIPTAIATGAGGQHLFSELIQRGTVAALFDFENRKQLFSKVHSSYKFCLLSLVGRARREPAAKYAFFLEDPTDLDDANRIFELSPEEISLINPNTRNLPVFRSRRDADLTAKIYRRMPVLLLEESESGNPWGIRFKNLYNSTDDSDLFQHASDLKVDGWTRKGSAFMRGGDQMLPVYEGKMAHLFDHRWNRYYDVGDNDYELVPESVKANPRGIAEPRRWTKGDGYSSTVRRNKEVKVPGALMRLRAEGWRYDWLCGWRDIARTNDERTAIPALIPLAATVETFPLMLPSVPPALTVALVAAQSSLVFDFVARQKASGAHIGRRIWKQLPVPTPAMLEPHTTFITPRVLELVYTTYDMAGLANDLGDSGEPFQWNETRRAHIRAELDAYFFHIYGIDRPDVEYILESFQTETGGLKNNELAKFGTYRTKNLVLAEYDRMTQAAASWTSPLIANSESSYSSRLNPPPGQGPRH